MSESVERPRRDGRPGRRARVAGERVGPAEPTNPDLPVHRQKAEMAESYVWEPFARSNFMSVVSGHKTERIVSRLASELVDWVVGEFSDVAAPRYRFSLQSWARSEAVVALLTHHLDRVDVVDEEGAPREKWLGQLRAAERRAAEERKVLGFSPSDLARVERQRMEAAAGAASLDGIRAAGRGVLDRHREPADSGARLGLVSCDWTTRRPATMTRS